MVVRIHIRISLKLLKLFWGIIEFDLSHCSHEHAASAGE